MIGNTREVELLFRRLKHVGRSDTEGDMIQADTVGIKMIIDVRLRRIPTKSDFMIWRAGTLFSLLMARLLAVRGFDAIQVSPR